MVRRILVTTALCAAASLAVLIASGPGMRSAAVTGTAELANWGVDTGGGESSSQSFGAGWTTGELSLGEATSENFGAQGGFRAASLCFEDNDGLDDAAEAALGTSTCAFDSDVDGLGDGLESWCGSNPTSAPSKPERIDLPGDEDADGMFNEALPSPGSDGFDCDGDGWKGSDEMYIYSGANTARDQDPCGSNGWPADILNDVIKPNGVGILDLTDYIAPNRYYNTNIADWGDPVAARRHDVSPGTNALPKEINILDLTLLVVRRPPMLAGGRNYGSTCPWPP